MSQRLTAYTSQITNDRPVRWQDMQPGVLYLHIPKNPDDGMAEMLCPCGCARQLVMHFSDMPQVWSFELHDDQPASLHPSIHIKEGCHAHFVLSRGEIQWCT